jgi:hypothetical protein
MPDIKNPFLAETLRGNNEVLGRARELGRIVSDESLAFRPPGGGWTAGQALEHIVVSGQLYMNKLPAIIQQAHSQRKTGDRQWKPSLMGGVIMRSINPRNTTRRKTQKIFEPGPTPRPNVIGAVIRLHEELGREIKRADGLDLRAVRLSSPVTPLIRMNLGDALGILVLHAQRHLLQAEKSITEAEARV